MYLLYSEPPCARARAAAASALDQSGCFVVRARRLAHEDIEQGCLLELSVVRLLLLELSVVRLLLLELSVVRHLPRAGAHVVAIVVGCSRCLQFGKLRKVNAILRSRVMERLRLKLLQKWINMARVEFSRGHLCIPSIQVRLATAAIFVATIAGINTVSFLFSIVIFNLAAFIIIGLLLLLFIFTAKVFFIMLFSIVIISQRVVSSMISFIHGIIVATAFVLIQAVPHPIARHSAIR